MERRVWKPALRRIIRHMRTGRVWKPAIKNLVGQVSIPGCWATENEILRLRHAVALNDMEWRVWKPAQRGIVRSRPLKNVAIDLWDSKYELRRCSTIRQP